ncbi:MAG: serine/threonine protein kinase [Pirellulaceae bacterium]|nr:serine/threonine protein kinase [Pirellulaceae bacterium]
MMDDTHLSDDEVRQLLEWDEALARGADAPASHTPPAAGDSRLVKQIRCMKLLRQACGRRVSIIAGQHDHRKTLANSTASTVTPLAADLPSLASNSFPAALGKYELRDEIGRGGYGVVFLAYDRTVSREVALKVPHAGVLMREELLMRFRIEARAAAVLDHPNIVPVYDAGNIGPVAYIASAYCPGISLHEWLSENSSPAAPRQAAELALCLAQAIQHANERGVFHRDLKPANILLQPIKTLSPHLDQNHAARRAQAVAVARHSALSALIPKITDFGLAKLLDQPQATLSGSILGTPAYMAPEQASGQSKTSTSRVDVYALGAILYQLLSGNVPFEGQSPLETLHRVIHESPMPIRTLRPSVSKDLETICLKCLEKDPGQRYTSAGQLAEDLQRYLNHEPILARPASASEQLLRLFRRKPLASSLVVALACAIVIGLATVSFLLKQSEVRRVQIQQALNETAAANELASQRQRISQKLLYLNSISLADRESTVNLSHARQELIKCDPQLRHWEWDYLWKKCNPELLDLSGHRQATRVCRFSPDGKLIASGSGSWGLPQAGEVIVRDSQTGRIIWEFNEHIGQITGLAFHPHHHWLVSSDQSWRSDQHGKTVVWDLENGQYVTALRLARSTHDVQFDPSGDYLATAGFDGRVRIFRTEGWRLVRTIVHHNNSVHEISFHPSGKLLATAGRDGRMGVFEVQTGKLIYEQDDLNDARCVSFNADGSLLACSTFDGYLLIWRTSDWNLLARRYSSSGRIGSMSFCPDGDSVLVTTLSGSTELWNALTGHVSFSVPGHYPGTLYATTSPTGDLIATCGFDAQLKIWSLTSNSDSKVSRVQNAYVSDVVVIPGTRAIATGVTKNLSFVGAGDGDYAIRIFDRAEGKITRLLAGHTDWTTKLDVSADGLYLASASLDGNVKLWQIETGECLQTFIGHHGPVTDVVFGSSTVLASAGQDGSVKLWHTETGEMIADHSFGKAPVTSLAAAPATGWLAAASQSGLIEVWNLQYPDLRLSCSGHEGIAPCLSMTKGGERLAAGSNSYSITLWDIPKVEAVIAHGSMTQVNKRLTCQLPSREVKDLQFLPDGQRLAYACTDFRGTAALRMIDTETGKEALQLASTGQTVAAVTYDPQQQELVWAVNNFVHLIDAQLPTLTERWQRHSSDRLRWHASQADSAERQQRAYKLGWHLTHLIAADPTNARHYFRRTGAYAAQEQWDLAKNDLQKHFELAGASDEAPFYFGLLSLAQGDLVEFHDACDELIQRLATSNIARDANALAWALALIPERRQDLELMEERVDFACTKTQFESIRHLSYNTQGLVFYRAGKMPQALESVKKSIELKNGSAHEADWILLAMIHHALGNIAESRKWLQVAERSLDQAVFIGSPASKAYSRNWFNRYQMQLLLQEARKLHQ